MPTVSPSSPFNYHLRVHDINVQTNALRKKAGLQQIVSLNIGEFGKSPRAFLSTNTIQIPSWFLINYDDFPDEYRIIDINDSRLLHPNFLNEVAEWMNGKLREIGLSAVCRPVDHGVLQIVLKLMRDKDLYDKSRQFTLCHELAHLLQNQTEGVNDYYSFLQKAVSFAGTPAGILLFLIAVTLIPAAYISVAVGATGIAVGVFFWKYYNRSEEPPIVDQARQRELEKAADLKAVQLLGDARGGMYYFDTNMLHNQALRRFNRPAPQNIDSGGNDLNDKKHPPLNQRYAYLRYWQEFVRR